MKMCTEQITFVSFTQVYGKISEIQTHRWKNPEILNFPDAYCALLCDLVSYRISEV